MVLISLHCFGQILNNVALSFINWSTVYISCVYVFLVSAAQRKALQVIVHVLLQTCFARKFWSSYRWLLIDFKYLSCPLVKKQLQNDHKKLPKCNKWYDQYYNNSKQLEILSDVWPDRPWSSFNFLYFGGPAKLFYIPKTTVCV